MARVLPAAAVRRAMIARSWNNARLAKEAGLDPHTVSAVLRDEADITVQTEAAIVGAFGRHPVTDSAQRDGVRELLAS